MTSAVPVFATPNQDVLNKQEEYKKFQEEIDKQQGEIFKLNSQIEPLIETIENNTKESENIKAEIENTKKEIEASKLDMEKQEELLGKRLREMYKNGGQSSYLAVILGADSFSDLITRIDSAVRLINIDKKVVESLVSEQEELNNKISSLEEKRTEIQRLTNETEESLKEFEAKKAEQEKMVADVKAKQAKFDEEYLAVAERELVSYQFGVIDSSSSKSELRNAIDQLESIKQNQINSPTIIEEINQYIVAGENRIDEIIAQEQVNNISNAPNRGESNSGSVSSSNGSSTSGSSIVSYAYQFIGVPYVWGGTDPSGFDCSGFTSYVYRHAAGIEITRTTYTQINQGVAVAYENMQPGDLVFTYGADHVGIYVGGGQYIHAPQPGDSIKVSPVTSFYAARRIL